MLDRHQLQQVPRAVPGDPPAAAQRRVDQPDRDVPADQPLVWHVTHPAVHPDQTVTLLVTGGQGGCGELSEFRDRPQLVHAIQFDTVIVTVSISV